MKPQIDLIIRGRDRYENPLAIAVSEGVIVEITEDLTESSCAELFFENGLIYPAWIDAHVHFNEPGRADWEGIASGSMALAAGGGCAYFDMPLNSSPPVVSQQAFDQKKQLCEQKSYLDFALWGGLIPSSVDQLESMAAAGAIGFKAFMCHSGLDEFPAADPETLRRGMQISARLGLPIAVHAEIAKPMHVEGRDMRAWLASRPIEFELDAIRIAIDLAGETGCALHIVHVTCPEGIDLVTHAKNAGIDVTVETCPHYLLLSEQDAIEIGAAAKCAPPLRSAERVTELWKKLNDGAIDTIGSDHSPAPPDMKLGDDMFAIWGGIAGIQHGLPLLLEKKWDLTDQLSRNAASRFKLPNKGQLAVGCDADFTIITRDSHEIASEQLLTHHRISPYLGRMSSFRIAATYLRGQSAIEKPRGKFLKPNNF
ncbi:MAG: allantoinase AllB [Verrucomicrobia bacterium]|nr:MAG: allantoinase AllB [Verrucomicrobiota bacterium]